MSASMLALIDYCDAVECGVAIDPQATKRWVLGLIDIRKHIASGRDYTLKQTGECIMRLISGDGSVDFGVLPSRVDDPMVKK